MALQQFDNAAEVMEYRNRVALLFAFFVFFDVRDDKRALVIAIIRRNS
jgi:hypothetical protein